MSFSTVWRTTFAWLTGLSFTAILIIPGCIAFLLDPIRQRLVQPMIRFWGRGIIRLCCVPVTVTGLENIRDIRSAVFVGNHQSMLDIFLYLGFIPRNGAFLAKKQVIWVPIIGWLLLIFGHIRIDRSNPKESLASVQRCIKAIDTGWSIFIFPEGTRTDAGEIKPFKSGSMKIPLRTGAPVVPITIQGAFRVMRKQTFAVHRHPIVMHIGEPIPAAGLDVKDFKPFVQQVEDKIRQTSERLLAELEAQPTAQRGVPNR